MSTVQQAVVFGFDVDAEAFKKKVEALGDKLAPKMEALGKRIGTKLRNTFEGVQNLITGVFKKIAIASAAAGAAIGVWTTMMGRSFIETARFAKAIGVSTQEMRTMQSAARIAGADVESLNQSFRMFREKMGEAQSLGTGEAIEALDGLKLRVEDLQNASLPEVFDIINQRIESLGLNSAQARDYVEKLGIEYDTFSAIVSNGALQEAQEIMARFGIVTADQEALFIRVSEKAGAFMEVIRALGLQIANGLMPVFDMMAGMLYKQLPGGFSTVSGSVTEFSASAIVAISQVIAKIQELIGFVRAAAADISGALSNITRTYQAIKEGRWVDAIKENFGWADPNSSLLNPIDLSGSPEMKRIQEEVDAQVAATLKAGEHGANVVRAYGLQLPLPPDERPSSYTKSDRNIPPALTPPGFTNAAPTGGGGGGGGAASAIKAAKTQTDDFTKSIEKNMTITKTWWQEMQVGAEDTRNQWISAFDGMGDAVAEFVKTGKFDINSLFASIADGFIDLAMKQMMYGTQGGGGILGAIMGGLTGSLGGTATLGGQASPNAIANAMSGAGGMYFNGGVVNRPTKFYANGGLASMAEKGAEAILPLQRNARGQLGVVSAGGDGGGSQVVNINTTINAPQTTGNPTEDANAMAKQFNRIIETKIVDVLSKQRRSKLGGF